MKLPFDDYDVDFDIVVRLLCYPLLRHHIPFSLHVLITIYNSYFINNIYIRSNNPH